MCSLWFNRVIRPPPPLWVLQEIVGFAALGNWWLEVKTNLDFISDYTIGREKIAKWTKKKITQWVEFHNRPPSAFLPPYSLRFQMFFFTELGWLSGLNFEIVPSLHLFFLFSKAWIATTRIGVELNLETFSQISNSINFNPS